MRLFKRLIREKKTALSLKINSLSFAILVNYVGLRLFIQCKFYINYHEKRLIHWHRVTLDKTPKFEDLLRLYHKFVMT